MLSFQNGDIGAFERIYAKHRSSLIATASNMITNRTDAVDLVHDVFTIAIERLHQLENPAALTPWLFQILRREIYRRRRHWRTTMSVGIVEVDISHLAAPEDPLYEAARSIADETASIVRQSLSGLDHRDQILFAAATRQHLFGSETLNTSDPSPGDWSDSTSRMMILRMRERLAASRSAYLVARFGQRSCPQLRQLLRDWDSTFSPLIRKRISRHIDTCVRCQQTRQRFSSVTVISLILACGTVCEPPRSNSETPKRGPVPAIQPTRDPDIPR